MKNLPALFPLRSPEDLTRETIELHQWFLLNDEPGTADRFSRTRSPGRHARLLGKIILHIGDDGVRQPMLPPIDGTEEFGLVTVDELVHDLLPDNCATPLNMATLAFFQKLSLDTPVVLKWH